DVVAAGIRPRESEEGAGPGGASCVRSRGDRRARGSIAGARATAHRWEGGPRDACVSAIELDGLDGADPALGRAGALDERGDRVEDRVGEAADVEDVVAIERLRVGVGLDVDAHQLRLRVALLQELP